MSMGFLQLSISHFLIIFVTFQELPLQQGVYKEQLESFKWGIKLSRRETMICHALLDILETHTFFKYVQWFY